MKFNEYLKLHKLGRLNEAEKGYRNLIKQNNISPLLYTSLGLVCIKTNREKEAIKLFNQAIKINPKDDVAINNLGLIYLSKKEHQTAKKYFLESIKIKKNSKVFFYLGQIYIQLNNIEKAIFNLKESIKITEDAEALCNLGHLLYLKGEILEAEKYTCLALKYKPNLDIARNNLGLINLSKGNINEAKHDFSKAIKINTHNFMAHYNLSIITDYSTKNLHEKELLNLIKSSKNNNELLHLSFAVAKLYKDKKDYKKSFKYYKSANSIKRKTFDYSLNEDKIKFKNIENTLSLELFNRIKGFGFDKKKTIFIVGMPRSGTSLIEQVLSSHTKVYGAGEVNFFDEILSKYFLNKKKLLDSKLIKKENLYKAGKEYIKKIESFANSKKILINKLPLNFRWMGLIKLVLPNSIIIHCKRNPMDTCLSIFEQNFLIKGNEYTFNLDEIGHFYKLYEDSISHWKKLLINDFYEIQYEKLVNNQKEETKKLLKFCSLKWENKCINFYKNKSIVRTASVQQVRKKIYTSSVNKAEIYKSELTKLKKILN
ncbi:MAG: hypothetical protein CFH18_00409 [Alphaproteobacteria bacterium MarineAlpha5_Bin8]|nr:MAG: hypothetical protein CFH17_00116 [Alphaproteobacteria bacterium MarineAlpha5_Bin7]PPR47401.1 MAG: hypothetical protein CFH18_00409 [Alphaproteobacteria bacterium MarineAlpha5_Bin8]|tara:strand:- start:857 stop:2479 length:1623 start_codon:yes stop_codon:yes gene_type:complete